MEKLVIFNQVRISGQSRYQNGYPIGTIGYVFEHDSCNIGQYKGTGIKPKEVKAYAISCKPNPLHFISDWFGYTRRNFHYTGVSISIPLSKIRKSDGQYNISLRSAYQEKLKQRNNK